jgi:hypothetical protein
MIRFENIVNDTISKVIDELASTVSDLQDLGVSKVLVNTMIGCSAWLTRRSDEPHSSSNDDGNAYTDEHNTALCDQLGGEDDVMLLDVNSPPCRRNQAPAAAPHGVKSRPWGTAAGAYRRGVRRQMYISRKF